MGHRNSRNGEDLLRDTEPSYEKTDWQERSRKQYLKQAERWTVKQAKRLGVTADEILAAVQRGHFSEHIEKMKHRDQLHEAPGGGVKFKVIGTAPLPRDPGRRYRN